MSEDNEVDHMLNAANDSDGNSDLENMQTIGQFVQYISAWHAEKLALINTMRVVPVGTVIQVTGSPTVLLDGEAMVAFQHGIDLVLSMIGTLPIVVEFEEVPASDVKSD